MQDISKSKNSVISIWKRLKSVNNLNPKILESKMKRILQAFVMTVIVFCMTFTFVGSLNQAPALANQTNSPTANKPHESKQVTGSGGSTNTKIGVSNRGSKQDRNTNKPSPTYEKMSTTGK